MVSGCEFRPLVVFCACTALHAVGCFGGAPTACPTPEVGRTTQALTGATDSPGVVSLDADQRLAIVSVHVRTSRETGLCSGVAISERWVLTANHCGMGGTLMVSLGGTAYESARIAVVEQVPHPTDDLLLLRIAEPLPGVRPIPPVETSFDSRWVGQVAQLSGFGVDENEGVGALAFVAEEIREIRADGILVDGVGRSGACIGDSGGPLLVPGVDGTPRVAGVLSGGAADCRSTDLYARVDTARDWLEEIAGPFADPSVDCMAIPAEGRCRGGDALFCEGGAPRLQQCGSGEACGWDESADGYRCIDPRNDPCEGVPATGTCDSGRALHCDAGQLVVTRCAACGEDVTCGRRPDDGRAACVPSLADQ